MILNNTVCSYQLHSTSDLKIPPYNLLGPVMMLIDNL